MLGIVVPLRGVAGGQQSVLPGNTAAPAAVVELSAQPAGGLTNWGVKVHGCRMVSQHSH